VADLAQLERALINADAAGDADAARALAGEIKRMRSTPVGPAAEASPASSASLTDALRPEFVKGSGNPFSAGIAQGAAGLASLPIQTIQNVLNLSRAGAGSVMGALGLTDMMPSADVQLPGNFQSVLKGLSALGLQTENPRPDDPMFRAAEIAGGNVPAMAIPGATAGQTALSTVGQVVGEQVGGDTGRVIGAMAPAVGSAVYQATRGQTLANSQKTNATRDATVAKAREEGYRFPPAETNPTLVNRALEGWAGKLSTRQMASAKNAEVTTNIAKRSIGLKSDDVLDEASLTKVRDQAGQAYEAIKTLPKPFQADAKLRADIQSLDSAVSRAAKEYPDLVKNPGIDELKTALASKKTHQPEAIVELIKDLRFQAKQNYKGSFAAQKPAEQIALADAQRKSADILEGFIERSLSRTGQSGLVKDFREARTTIARTHDIESALNEASGTVNAKVFSNLSDKGRPLGGGLEIVARTHKAFPHDLKTPESIGSQPLISPLDVGAGSMVAGSNMPGLLGLMLGRPLVRSAIMSKPYQAAMGDPNYSPMLQPDNALASLLRGNIAGNMTQ
jgi:hypothetical protein